MELALLLWAFCGKSHRGNQKVSIDVGSKDEQKPGVILPFYSSEPEGPASHLRDLGEARQKILNEKRDSK